MERILARGARMETFRGFESLSLDADDFSRAVCFPYPSYQSAQTHQRADPKEYEVHGNAADRE
jgi:hypothetical protein